MSDPDQETAPVTPEVRDALPGSAAQPPPGTDAAQAARPEPDSLPGVAADSLSAPGAAPLPEFLNPESVHYQPWAEKQISNATKDKRPLREFMEELEVRLSGYGELPQARWDPQRQNLLLARFTVAAPGRAKRRRRRRPGSSDQAGGVSQRAGVERQSPPSAGGGRRRTRKAPATAPGALPPPLPVAVLGESGAPRRRRRRRRSRGGAGPATPAS